MPVVSVERTSSPAVREARASGNCDIDGVVRSIKHDERQASSGRDDDGGQRAKADPAKCSAGHTDTRTALICDTGGGGVLNSMQSESPAHLSTPRSRNERLVPAAARHDSSLLTL